MSTELETFDSLKAEVTLFVSPVTQITVTDIKSNEIARDTLKKIVALKRVIEVKRLDATRPLNDRIKQIRDYAESIEAPLLEAEKFVKGKMGEYAAAAEKARVEEQKRIEAEAREIERKAAEERQKIEAEARAKREAEEKKAREVAEAKRIETERAAKEEAEALAAFGANDPEAERVAAEQAEAARLAAIEEQRLISERLERERLEQEARFQREADERERARRAQEKALEASRPKNSTTVWHYEIQDSAKVPAIFWIINEPAITKAVKSGAREIPGVKIWSTQEVVAR